jgi:hypothetical protein
MLRPRWPWAFVSALLARRSHLRWDSGIPTPAGGVEYGPDGGVVVPAVFGLHVAARR